VSGRTTLVHAGLVALTTAAFGARGTAQEAPTTGLLEAGRPECVAWLLQWASGGGDAGGLATYGTAALSDLSEGFTPRDDGAGRVALGIEVDGARGPVLAGLSVPAGGEAYGYTGPTRSRDAAVGARARGEVSLRSVVAAIDVAAYRDRSPLRLLAVGASGRRLGAYAGALPLRTGAACRDGLVLGGSDRAHVRGVELRQRSPFSLPLLGAVRLGVQVGVMREAAPGNDWPLFHSMRIELAPHDDVVVGLNRAVVFGGSQTDVDVTPRTVALMLVGLTDTPGKDSDFENQVASVDLRWRARVLGRPLLTTVEYGTDDSGWAFLNVPGLLLATAMDFDGHWLGVSSARLAGPTGTYPPWYRHGTLAWGWSDRGEPIGNPLGGEAGALFGTYRRATEATVLDVAAGVVDRGESNLYSPDLAGVRMHGTIDFLWRAGKWELSARVRGDLSAPVAGRATVSMLRSIG
jgi:hypothetical protein